MFRCHSVKSFARSSSLDDTFRRRGQTTAFLQSSLDGRARLPESMADMPMIRDWLALLRAAPLAHLATLTCDTGQHAVAGGVNSVDRGNLAHAAFAAFVELGRRGQQSGGADSVAAEALLGRLR